MASLSLSKSLLSGPFLVGLLMICLIVGAIVMYVKRGGSGISLFESFSNENSTCGGMGGNSDGIPVASEPLGQNETNQTLMEDEETNPLGNDVPKDCFPHDHLNPKDLLPSDVNTKWAQSNPDGQGTIGDKNFLNAGFHVGINTVGQSLRNSNLQLRSEPPNPQGKVSPWMQSTIDPDLNRKPLEIGGDDE